MCQEYWHSELEAFFKDLLRYLPEVSDVRVNFSFISLHLLISLSFYTQMLFKDRAINFLSFFFFESGFLCGDLEPMLELTL